MKPEIVERPIELYSVMTRLIVDRRWLDDVERFNSQSYRKRLRVAVVSATGN
jgi:hypothetical protein